MLTVIRYLTKNLISILLLACVLLVGGLSLSSCTPKGIIPSKDLTDIYYDFYMADAYFESKRTTDLGDSVMIYVPIIEKHGYTLDDYQTSVDYYLHHTEDLIKILKNTEKKIKDRAAYVDAIIKAEEEKRNFKFVDSLDFYGSSHFRFNGFYRSLYSLVYKADSVVIDSSPIIDSTLFDRIENVFFLYDTVPSLYNRVKLTDKYVLDTLKIDTLKVDTLKIDKLNVDSLKKDSLKLVNPKKAILKTGKDSLKIISNNRHD